MRYTKSLAASAYQQLAFADSLELITKLLTRMQTPAEATWSYTWNENTLVFELIAEWEDK